MKILILLLILFSTTLFSQNLYFAVGTDIRNAIIGSDPTNNEPSFDVIYSFGMIGNLKSVNDIECTIGYENFNRICFDRYFLTIGKHIHMTDSVIIIPSYEFSLIDRWGSAWGTTSSHLSFIGANLSFRYRIYGNISLEMMTSILNRVDLNARYGGNVFKLSNAIVIIMKL